MSGKQLQKQVQRGQCTDQAPLAFETWPVRETSRAESRDKRLLFSLNSPAQHASMLCPKIQSGQSLTNIIHMYNVRIHTWTPRLRRDNYAAKPGEHGGCCTQNRHRRFARLTFLVCNGPQSQQPEMVEPLAAGLGCDACFRTRQCHQTCSLISAFHAFCGGGPVPVSILR